MEKRVDLCYPEQETWFICWDKERKNIMAYDSILTTQCLSTKWLEIDYYIIENLWIEVLYNNGIELPVVNSEEEE